MQNIISERNKGFLFALSIEKRQTDGLGVKTKKLYHWEEQHIKQFKKSGHWNNFKSKKPKKYAKNGRFFYPRGPIFKIIEASFSVLR